MVIGDEQQCLLCSLAGRGYDAMVNRWDKRKECPDITVTFDQTVVVSQLAEV